MSSSQRPRRPRVFTAPRMCLKLMLYECVACEREQPLSCSWRLFLRGGCLLVLPLLCFNLLKLFVCLSDVLPNVLSLCVCDVALLSYF